MTDWTDEEIAEERITNLLRDVEILTRRAEAAEAEAKIWQECSARQDHELDEAARKLDAAEAEVEGLEAKLAEESATKRKLAGLVADAEAKLAEVLKSYDAAAQAWGRDETALAAEVERLRGLPDEISAEAHAVPVGETFHGGGLHGAPRFDVMMWAVSRIRAALRGGGE